MFSSSRKLSMLRYWSNSSSVRTFSEPRICCRPSTISALVSSMVASFGGVGSVEDRKRALEERIGGGPDGLVNSLVHPRVDRRVGGVGRKRLALARHPGGGGFDVGVDAGCGRGADRRTEACTRRAGAAGRRDPEHVGERLHEERARRSATA